MAMQCYRVGGWVRDRLLGRTQSADCDWVVIGATAEQMISRGFRPIEASFPVFIHPESGDEFALARCERKVAPGYHGFVCCFAPDVTLEQDLLRRDLTINAMAMDSQGQIIDLVGGGRDIGQRWLRHVSPAFAEDPLRVLRLARFQAQLYDLGFRVAPETASMVRAMVGTGELAFLAGERVWRETEKALASAHPECYFSALHEWGALAAVVPELAPSLSDEQQWLHSLSVLQQATARSADLLVRFASWALTMTDVDWQRLTLPIPRRYGQLVQIARQLRDDYDQVMTMTATQLVRFLTRIAAWHGDSARRDRLLLTWAIVAVSDRCDNWLRSCISAGQQVDKAALYAEGYQGKDLGMAIEQARVSQIERLWQG
ncbi:MAG: multifunctional CCA tRNA nucleotidyl transferase/2'3'-cyclic phosphodiesterase/2'nucleotidase/phosphatase [Magnetococcales bacterium]|nr:multifunctional CCA tRNA nucleotidyl transferase/2'3'-cyclic phosphodiesterase/2'nucleotidase/phosphatase [Magnetococcales bacterium]